MLLNPREIILLLNLVQELRYSRKKWQQRDSALPFLKGREGEGEQGKTWQGTARP